MFFLGYTSALGGIHAGDPMLTNVSNITYSKLSNSIVNDDYITKDTTSSTLPLTPIWDFNTIYWAKFNGNLLAGNTDFALSSVSHILTKIREYGSYQWINIFSNLVTNESSLSFENFYKYCKAKTEYEVALVPVMSSGIEGNYNINTVTSDFNGTYIFEKDSGYNSNMDTYISSNEKYQDSSIINPLLGKYPYVIYPSENQYDTLSVQGFFNPLDSNKLPDFTALKTNYAYRTAFKNWLTDHKPKVLKSYTSEIWLGTVTDKPKDSKSAGLDYTTITFTFTEIGSTDDQNDLYTNGLTDVIS